eukprot:1176403-Prorocentrum_minimum.AAC.1
MAHHPDTRDGIGDTEMSHRPDTRNGIGHCDTCVSLLLALAPRCGITLRPSLAPRCCNHFGNVAARLCPRAAATLLRHRCWWCAACAEVLRQLGRLEDWDAMEEFNKRMRRAGMPPCVRTVNVIAAAHARAGRTEAALAAAKVSTHP